MATSPLPPPAPQPPLRESDRDREYNESPTIKYLNSVDLYNVTSSPRRDSKSSNASLSKNDYYYDKENELYSMRKSERDLKLAPPREDRVADFYEEQRQQTQHQHHLYQTRTNTSTATRGGSISYNATRLSPIMSSPTHDVTKTVYIF